MHNKENANHGGTDGIATCGTSREAEEGYWAAAIGGRMVHVEFLQHSWEGCPMWLGRGLEKTLAKALVLALVECNFSLAVIQRIDAMVVVVAVVEVLVYYS